MRRACLTLHKWIGLTTAVLILVIGASGAAEVYEAGIDRALNPATSYVTPAGSARPVVDLLRSARAARPVDEALFVRLADAPDRSVEVLMRGGLSVCLDPYTGRVLGTRDRGKGTARFIHRLHTELLAGAGGQKLVDWMDAAFLGLAVTGLYLWWPRRIASVRRASSWKRMNFDLHNAVGFFGSLVFLAIAASGVLIGFENTLDPVVARLNAWNPAPPRLESTAADPGAPPVAIDRALEAARRALPGALATTISVPSGRKAVYLVLMKFPEDRTPAGRSRVYVDQFSGRVLFVQDTRRAPLGTRIENLKRSAHTGDIFGAPTRALYFVAALAIALQAITGVLIWWNGRGGRSRDRRQARADQSV